MTRIISGRAGSLRLALATAGTRPTMDRVKESIFSKLENLISFDSINVLDLFAGTGALGLEAVSRGANRASFIENNRQAANHIAKNITAVKKAISSNDSLELRLTVTSASAFLKSTNEKFDLVFVDPPYSYSDSQIAEILSLCTSKMKNYGILVLERPAHATTTRQWGNLEEISTNTYGGSVVYFLSNS